MLEFDSLCINGGDFSVTLSESYIIMLWGGDKIVFMSESIHLPISSNIHTDSFKNETSGCLFEWLIESFT